MNQTQVIAGAPERVGAVRRNFEAASDEILHGSYLQGLTDKWLPHMIDFNHGLLDELISAGVINRKKYEPFRVRRFNNGSCSEARAQLINDVINASTEQKELFLSALDRTQQSHVTNYIRNNGRRPSDTDDNWPLFEERRVLQEHFYTLIGLIDVECGLLDEIISAGILTEEQRAAVSAISLQDRLKVMKLLDIMHRKSVANYKKFIDCLVKTKQFRVVSMLDPLIAATCPPLSEVHRTKLDANYSTLVGLIDTQDSGLLRELESVDCLTSKQRIFIESTESALVGARQLLDILRKGSQSDYDKFIVCLGRTGQQHVADVLVTATAVAVSPITARGTEIDMYESAVLQTFMDLLKKSSKVRGKELLLRAASALGPDNDLIFMKKTHSITLFIASQSLSGMIDLYDMYWNGQLVSILQHVFSELLGNKHDVIIDELTWDRSGYNRCMQHLSEASGLSVYPKIHLYSSDNSHSKPPVCSLSMDRFPHELTEMMLVKAAGQLFVIMQTKTTNAATYTFVTLSAVCRYCWETLTCRRSHTRRLRRYFMQLCRPFTFNPRLVSSLQTGGEDVNGVVAFDGKLFVAIRGSNTIAVYDLAGSSSNNPIEGVNIPGLINPYDLVVCSSTRCLFVSDAEARCIWRVNLCSADSNVVDQTTDQSPFITTAQYMPRNLSVHSERLLVTPYAGDALYFYNNSADFEGSQRINLPHYMVAYHAVETSRDTFVVAHVSKWSNDSQSDHTGVSELSADGHVLLVYQGPTSFSYPFYIATVNGHFLVSDCDNRNILHLNKDLELTQVLVADLNQNPVHQCYSFETGKLYVAYENSDTVTFHSV